MGTSAHTWQHTTKYSRTDPTYDSRRIEISSSLFLIFFFRTPCSSQWTSRRLSSYCNLYFGHILLVCWRITAALFGGEEQESTGRGIPPNFGSDNFPYWATARSFHAWWMGIAFSVLSFWWVGDALGYNRVGKGIFRLGALVVAIASPGWITTTPKRIGFCWHGWEKLGLVIYATEFQGFLIQ